MIDLNDTHQLIRGFGGVNMPGWNHFGDLTYQTVTSRRD